MIPLFAPKYIPVKMKSILSVCYMFSAKIKDIDVIYDEFDSKYKIHLAVVEISNFLCYCHQKFLHRGSNCLCQFRLYLDTSEPVRFLKIWELGRSLNLHSLEQFKSYFIKTHY